MISRSHRFSRQPRISKAAGRVVEVLEARAYLTGVELGSPVNLSTSSVGIAPVFANLADFNGDGKADLFVANSSNSVSVLLGNGDGSFRAPATIPVTGAPLPLAVGDFNNDGKLDIVAGTSGSPGGNISIILGNGDGTFGAADNISALGNNQAIAVADFNKDGNLDVISVSNNATASNNAEIVFGDGAGGSSSHAIFSLPHGSVSTVVTGDFNNDSNPDFAVVDQADNKVTVYLGNGNGTFRAPLDYATGASPTSAVAGDFNSDGKTDIITADSNGAAVSFLGGNGDGTFKAAVNSTVNGSGAGGGPLKVRTTNFDNDNKQDLLVLLSPGSTGDASVLLGNGDGTFHTGTIIATHSGTRNAIAAGFLNNDALTDVVVSNSSQVSALLNITSQDTTPPTALVDASQAAGGGSSQSNTYDFTVTYTDNQQVDASTLGNGNLTVTLPGGTTQAATLISQNLDNAATVKATYRLTFASNLTSANNGTYTVAMNANSVKDANGNAVAAGNIGTLTLNVANVPVTDTTAPTAAVDATQAVGSGQSNLYNFTVTYTDNVAVDAATLGNGNLLVTFPGNTSTVAATLLNTSLTSGPSIQATYQVAFPSTLTTANNGVYTVTVNTNSVKDTSGNAVAAGSIGAFNLTVDPNQAPPTNPVVTPTGDFTVTSPAGKIPAAVVTGAKQKGVTVRVTNGSANPITGTVTVTLYASNTNIHDGSAVALTQTIKKVKKLKSGKGFSVHFKTFNYPATAGTNFLVADAALNGVLDSFDGASSAITIAQAFVDANAVGGTNKTTIVTGKKSTVTFTIQNLGNVPYSGPATVDVSLVPTGGGTPTAIATAVPVKLSLKPSQSKPTHVSFVPVTLPAAGTYSVVLTITMPGDTNAANNTVTSSVPVTV